MKPAVSVLCLNLHYASQFVLLTITVQREFALKKIRCPTGSEDVRQAMREVEAYRRFKCVDFSIPRLLSMALIRSRTVV